VYIGNDVYIDEDYPETVEIHHEVVIAHRYTIIGHTRGVGKIVVEKQAAIEAACLIVCGPGQTLRVWMMRFKGVAIACLPNHVGWRSWRRKIQREAAVHSLATSPLL
jgi:hypothetical protein